MKMKKLATLTALIALRGISVEAAAVVWDGNSGSSGAWLTLNNWDTNTLPATSDLVQFPSFTNVATIVGIDFGSGNVNNGANNNAIGAIESTNARTNVLTIRNSSSTVDGTLTLNGTVVNGVSNVVLRNNSSVSLTLANGTSRNMAVALGNTVNNVIRIDGSGNVAISSIISGGSDKQLTLDGSGTGTLNLSGANTYAGGTTVNNRTLNLSGAGTLGSSAGSLTLNGGTLNLGGTNQVVGQLTGNGGTINTSTGSSSLTISGSDNTASAFSSIIANGAGTVSLTRSGTGTTIFSGANTYSGSTTITGGTLNLASTSTLSGATGTLAVGGGALTTSVSNANLGGGVNFSSGIVTLNAASAGSLTLSGANTFVMSGGTLNLSLGTSYDQIIGTASGAFTLSGGTINLDTSGVGFSYVSAYQIFQSFGSGSVSGISFTGITGYTANLSNTGSLTFTASAIPEPSTYAAIFGGFALIGVAIQRRRGKVSLIKAA